MTIRLCCILVVMALASAEAAIEIEQQGTPRRLRRAVSAVATEIADTVRLRDSVVSLLVSAGYLDAYADTDSSRIRIVAGKQYRLAELTVNADSTWSLPVDEPFSRRSLKEATARVLEQFYHQGYYFAQAKIRQIRRCDSLVRVEMDIQKGRVVTVSRIVYGGLTRSSPDVVGRYLDVSADDTLTPRLLEDIHAEALSIPQVRFRPPIKVQPLPGYSQVDLLVDFEERRQFLFEGGVGYAPDDATGLLWSLTLNFRNLFGGGRQARIAADRRERGRNRLAVDYRQPIYLIGVGYVGASVATRDYRERFYEFQLDGTYQARARRNLTVGLTVGWRSVEPVAPAPSYGAVTVSFAIHRTVLDDFINPARGLSLSWSLAYSHRRYKVASEVSQGPAGSFNETRSEVALEAFRPLVGPLVALVRFGYRGLETDESLVPISELYLLGGPGQLRGYRREQFAVVRAALGTVEPRLRFDQGYLFAFYDAGYLNDRVVGESGMVTTRERYRDGFGVGLALLGGGHLVKLSLAWNPELRFDEPWLSVHLSSEI